jgi:hypothetical protein
MYKLIQAPSPVDTPSVNCAWLTCGRIMRNLAQCVRRHGNLSLLSVMITGENDLLCYQFESNLPPSSHFRTNIENTHSHEVERLRKQYSFEEKQLIQKFLEAKESFNQKSETLVQESEKRGLLGKSDLTNSLFLSLS